jgi:hypothetical protein
LVELGWLLKFIPLRQQLGQAVLSGLDLHWCLIFDEYIGVRKLVLSGDFYERQGVSFDF